MPRLARSALRSGANALMPPICMPTELKLANPQMATVTIVRPFWDTMGSDLLVRFVKATNSLMVIFWPRRVAAFGTSFCGIPMAQAKG